MPTLTGLSFLPDPSGNEGTLNSAQPGVPPAAPQLDPSSGIRYVEVWPGSPQISLRDDGAEVSRKFYVAWDSYFDACKDMLGYPVIFRQSNGVFFIRRKLPLFMPDMLSPQHPCGNFGLVDDPPRPFLHATQIRQIEGKAAPKDRICKSQLEICRYRAATVELFYETLTYEIRKDDDVICWTAGDPLLGLPDESSWARYVTAISAPQANYLTLPPGSFMLANYPFPVPGSPGKVTPEFDLSVTWHRIPILAVGDRSVNRYITSDDSYIPPIEDCIGTVNKYDFNGHRKGTLLLVAAVLKPIRSAIGHRLYDIEYRYKRLTVRSADQQSGIGWTGSTYAYGHNLLYWSLSQPSQPPSGTGFYEVVAGATVIKKCTLTIGSGALAAIDSTAALSVGMFVIGEGIPAGAKIGAINGSSQVTMFPGYLATLSGPQNITFSTNAGGIFFSNARLDNPADNKNIYNYRDHKVLFRVPTLNF